MTIRVEKSKANGTVVAPPSKSVAHRALICGALTEKSIIKNIAMSKDIEATLSCLSSLGAKAEFISNDELIIGGLDFDNIPDDAILDCNESGSTLRFLIPLALLCGKKITFKGAERLMSRPLSVYEEIAKQKGFLFQKSEDKITLCGKLTAGFYEVAGDISSQFITGLILALSQIDGASQIKLTSELESASYVDITLGVMAEFGVDVKWEDNVFKIVGKPFDNREYTVEGDCSNAAFLDAFNLLGGNVTVSGLNADTLQGDRVYKEFFCDLKNGKKEFDLTDCPDLAPIMFALSAVYGGAKFYGTKRLAIKESDRAAAMAAELIKFGIKTEIFENSVEIFGGKLKTPSEILCGHNDHRIVMSLVTLCTLTGGTISGAEAVAKSFPDYFDKIKTLGIGITDNETE